MSSCLQPIKIPNSHYLEGSSEQTKYISVPCGQCLYCLRRKQNDWAFRILQEAKDYPDSTYFVTLTYNENNIPHMISEDGEDFGYTLNLSDIQKFHKRLRKYLSSHFNLLNPLRFFTCGEYGDTFDRPHYHCIYFLPFPIPDLKKVLESIWGKGFVTVSSLTVRRAKYVAKYTCKQLCDYYTNITAPFAVMSRNPAIGKSFLDKEGKFIVDNEQFVVYDEQGTPYPLPRYYKERLFSPEKILKHSSAVRKHFERLELSRIKQCELDGINPFKGQNETIERNYNNDLLIYQKHQKNYKK